MIESRYKPPRRRKPPTALEALLLLIGLAALAFAAGTGGWAIGRQTTSSEVSLAVPAVELTAPAEAPAATGAATTVAVEETTAGDATAGKELFVGAGCGSCHALEAAGAGGTVGPNLDQSKLSFSEVFDWVAKGEGGMPSFKGQLTEEQIQDVAAFIVQSTSG